MARRRRRYDYGGWAPYVHVADRRRRAGSDARALERVSGRALCPAVVRGRKMASTPWGRAWCDNLSAYSDYANRLPRGRSYVRNGSVIDLAILPGEVKALVSGSDIYEVTIGVSPIPGVCWTALKVACAGAIDSVVELLAGRLSAGVMKRLSRPGDGLFPTPEELHLDCSCPDWATMCKHVAATLYGVGARLDDQPELLFALRSVDHSELLGSAGALAAEDPSRLGAERILKDDLADLFGIDLEDAPPAAAAPPASPLITSGELVALGIPRSTFQNWVVAGHLGHTATRGTYRLTPVARERIAAATARAAPEPSPTPLVTRKRRGKTTPEPPVTRKPRAEPALITSGELIALGVPRSTFQNWVTAGHLGRTATRGTYRLTPVARERIAAATGAAPTPRSR